MMDNYLCKTIIQLQNYSNYFIDDPLGLFVGTLWTSNMAMENQPFSSMIFPLKLPFSSGMFRGYV